jgi:hypothetical protein
MLPIRQLTAPKGFETSHLRSRYSGGFMLKRRSVNPQAMAEAQVEGPRLHRSHLQRLADVVGK